jgi:membrane protein required for colicin V production
MTGFDYAVVAVIVLSALLGGWRGLVYEVLSLLAWIVAAVVARVFSASLAPYMPSALGTEAIKITAAFTALFIVTLIVGGIVTWLLSKLVKWVGLGWVDGLLGALFGMVRGVLVVVLAVVLAGLTDLPQTPFWRNAWSSRALADIALASRVWLPHSVAQRLHY